MFIVHGKVIVTAMSVQIKHMCKASEMRASPGSWLMRLRRPVVSSPHNEKTRSTDYKGLQGWSSQQILSKWPDHAV